MNQQTHSFRVVKGFSGLRCQRKIRTYIQNCECCLRYKQKLEWAELKPLEASYWVHMGYLKIGGKDDRNLNVLVITDHFTRYSQAYVTSNLQTSAYHPQTNGQPERFNHMLKTMLGLFA